MVGDKQRTCPGTIVVERTGYCRPVSVSRGVSVEYLGAVARPRELLS